MNPENNLPIVSDDVLTNPASSPENIPTNQQATPTPTQVPSPRYEDTPESKVVKEESPAWITAFEKKSDGYWYISFDYLQIKQGQGFINENTKIRTFRASPNLRIYQFDRMLNEPENYTAFSRYQSFMVKEGSHYINRAYTPGGFGTPNGYYEVFIENGQVITLDELYDHEADG